MPETETTITTPVQNLLLEGKNAVVWQMVCKVLEGSIGEGEVDRWFRPLTFVGVKEATLVLEISDEVFQVWIEMNHMENFAASIQTVFGTFLNVTYQQDTVAENSSSTDQESASHSIKGNDFGFMETTAKKKSTTSILRKSALKRPTLNPEMTFDTFVVGPNSQFAHAAAYAVGENDECTYNPLFIHGKPGNGKTHLCQAIAHEVLERNPDRKVLYLTCEKFTNDYIEALRKDELKRFRSKYRKVDLLIIEDVQFLSSKEKTQEEFFHTFNELMNSRSQLVLTSDRPASEIKNVNSRLTSRFDSGLAVEIEVPQVETRTAILRKRANQSSSKVTEEVICYIAEKFTSSVRKLIGALTTVTTYASLAKFTSIDMKQVEYLLRNQLAEEGVKSTNIEGIQRLVSNQFELKVSDLTGARRLKKVAFARQVAMFLSRELTKSSLAEIGENFGGRDHGTVLHAHKKIVSEINNDVAMKDLVTRLKLKLT